MTCVIVAAGVAFAAYAVWADRDVAAPAPVPAPVPTPVEGEAVPALRQSATTTATVTPPDIDRDTASREASWRESREAAIRIQQRLRAEEQARRTRQQEDAKLERCVGGQRMKRVENGWVQAGSC